MSLAVITSAAILAMDVIAVRVEVHIGQGLPSFQVVGLPDAGVKESRERVRAAIISSGYCFPAARITVNLAPADLPKDSGRYDLAIALGILLASGQTGESAATFLDQCLFAGELSLTGAVVPVSGSLALALGIRNSQIKPYLIMPYDSAKLACQVPSLNVIGVLSLTQAVEMLQKDNKPLMTPAALVSEDKPFAICMSDVQGQEQARFALEVAATGGHSMLMSGSPGVGKSMLAHRLITLLPPLSAQQQLEVAVIQQLGQRSENIAAIGNAPPYRAPHHSCTPAAMVGGGKHLQPGEISLAHHGVLFLDELPEFQRRVLESLREPLETGEIYLSRANQRGRYPALFQLIAAMNPCPCGYLGHAQKNCVCTTDQINKYRAKLSGPFLDRIDLHLFLSHENNSLFEQQNKGESSIDIRLRVLKCRQKQLDRQGFINAYLQGEKLEIYAMPTQPAQKMLGQAAQKWAWSIRVVHRIQRLARTIADMQESSEINTDHVMLAMQFRDQSKLIH